jgi:DNA-binding response OmpR family regulator
MGRHMNGNIRLGIGGSADASARCPRERRHQILVVDDNADMRRLSSRVLSRSGYRVDDAEDGVAGWEALRAGRYDLLITDHHMPKLTGVELVRKVRDAGMELAVILATASPAVEELARDPSLRLAATLFKPFPVTELLGIVRRVLGGGQSAPDAARSAPRG